MGAFSTTLLNSAKSLLNPYAKIAGQIGGDLPQEYLPVVMLDLEQ